MSFCCAIRALLTPAVRPFANYPGGHNEGFPDSFKQLFRAVYAAIDSGERVGFREFADGHREIVLCDAILRGERRRAGVGPVGWVSSTVPRLQNAMVPDCRSEGRVRSPRPTATGTMTGIMHPSIRLQLLFPLFPLVLGLAATTAWTAWSAAAAAERQIHYNLTQIADTVDEVSWPRSSILRLMKGSPARIFSSATSRERRASTSGSPPTTLSILPDSLPKPNTLATPRSIEIDGTRYLCRGVLLQHDLVYIFFPESASPRRSGGAVRPALLVGVAGGLASVLLAGFFTQRLTGRILSLQRRTRQIAGGDFSPMPLTGTQDELRDLSQSINEMAQQLARFQETSRATERLRLLGQVSGGLAHQRNGVAGVRLALQVHAREAPTDESIGVALRQLALVEIYLRVSSTWAGPSS